MERDVTVISDKEILGGTPVLVGTRVPVATLFDYLSGEESLDEFLEDFPTVHREQVTELREQCKQMILAPFA